MKQAVLFVLGCALTFTSVVVKAEDEVMLRHKERLAKGEVCVKALNADVETKIAEIQLKLKRNKLPDGRSFEEIVSRIQHGNLQYGQAVRFQKEHDLYRDFLGRAGGKCYRYLDYNDKLKAEVANKVLPQLDVYYASIEAFMVEVFKAEIIN